MKTSTQRKTSRQTAQRAEHQPDGDFVFSEGRPRIATTAYYKTKVRGFSRSREIDDWLQTMAESRQQAAK